MPHSHQDSVGSTDTFDLVAPMTATATYINKVNVGPNAQQSSLRTNAWKRTSLPTTDFYSDLSTRPQLDELLQQRAREAERKILQYDNVPKHRTPQTAEASKNGLSTSVREKIQRASPLIAELRTNVIVKDEYTLVTDLSHHLAKRYTRPNSAIMVNVDHSACLALGGSFDPCYILTVTNIPSQMSSGLNKRNAGLIQAFMADILSVPPDRGVVKFYTLPEDCLAINGTTVLGEMERQDKQQLEAGPEAMRWAASNGNRKSVTSFQMSNSKLDLVAEQQLTSNGTLSRKQSSTSQRSQYAAIEDAEMQRPSTSHGPNGLNSNPVWSDVPQELMNLTDSRLPNGRPKTFSSEAPMVVDHSAKVLLPQNQRLSSTSQPLKADRPPSFLSTDPVNSTTNKTSKASKRLSSQSLKDTKSRVRENYSDVATITPPVNKSFAEQAAVAALPLDEPDTWNKERTANTRKRRSTINTTPKIPQAPPVPETTSMRSFRLGKRKSFLSVFRRGATAA